MQWPDTHSFILQTHYTVGGFPQVRVWPSTQQQSFSPDIPTRSGKISHSHLHISKRQSCTASTERCFPLSPPHSPHRSVTPYWFISTSITVMSMNPQYSVVDTGKTDKKYQSKSQHAKIMSILQHKKTTQYVTVRLWSQPPHQRLENP